MTLVFRPAAFHETMQLCLILQSFNRQTPRHFCHSRDNNVPTVSLSSHDLPEQCKRIHGFRVYYARNV